MKHWKDICNFKSWGFAPRMAAAFVLLIIVPYICLAVVVFWFYQEHVISGLKESAMDTITAAASGIHAAMLERKDDSMSVYYGGCVELLDLGRPLSGQEEKMITEHLSAISYANTDVLAVYLLTEQGTFHSGGNYSGVLMLMEPYEEEIAAAGGRCLWYATNKLYGKAYENKYILARSLNGQTEKNIGILYLVLNDNMVTEALGQLSTEYAEWYLTDAGGMILYASDVRQIGDRMDVSSLSMKKRKSSYTALDGQNEKVVIEAYSLMDVGWYCISKIRMQSVRRGIFSLVMPFLVIVFICIQFMLLMLRMLQKHVFVPLRLLKASMYAYAQDEIAETKAEIFGIGEFRSLSEHFNHMTLRISRLIKAYKEEEEEKNRQRMKALAAQLTPHFVYNALNTIKWVAVLNHQEKIQHLVESLVGIFMNAARADDENYTLGDEIELVKNYAVIQKARFMNFELEIEAEEECRKYRIRKLLLQPIVENAIVHGLNRGKIKEGRVWVRAWADENLHLSVKDNGVGFDIKQWREYPEKNEEHTNIGIMNVEEIIRLEYGAQYGLQIESVIGSGTEVVYTLPVIYADEQKTLPAAPARERELR